MPKAICVATGKEVKEGYKVIDDPVIKFIRAVKMRMGSYKGNLLYVSEEAKEEYVKKRKGFERYLLIATGIAIVILVLAVFLPLVTSDFNRALSNLLPSLFFSLIFYFLAFAQYVPRFEDKLTKVPAKYISKDDTPNTEKNNNAKSSKKSSTRAKTNTKPRAKSKASKAKPRRGKRR